MTERVPPSQRRLLAILDDAVAKLEEVERAKTEPVAVIGAGCRFPGGATDTESFWRLLQSGFDAVTEVPLERWDANAFYDPRPGTSGKMYTRHGSFLENVDRFDPQFFGMSPREAISLDPQHRLLLETAWEALENAGQTRDRLHLSQTGVFVGITTNEYSLLLQRAASGVDTYFSTGVTLNAAAGRLSYFLGLQGPSIAVDSACSSSLVTVHLACQSLRSGECNLALAGGVNLILCPENTVALSQARMLAPDGRCKTFDASADGYGRGEGCGVVVLKRLSDALADRDSIVAVIRGSAVNQDGPSSGFTVPSGPAQQALIRRCLSNARLQPSDVDYVEAHGTGTSLGDPIEVRALAGVYGENRQPDRPLVLGSVKTNFGHLESAAGIAGFIKVALSLKHAEIPPHLHFREPNPNIAWRDIPLVVPVKRLAWPTTNKPRVAAVSAFGASGTNAHVILEEAPRNNPTQFHSAPETARHALTISATTESALRELAKRYVSFFDSEFTRDFADVCFSANTGRTAFSHRLGITADSVGEARQKLEAFLDGSDPNAVFQGFVRMSDASAKPVIHSQDAAELARAWVNGGIVDWHALYKGAHYRRVQLPNYAWERERYWVEDSSTTPRAAVAGDDWLYTVDWVPVRTDDRTAQLPSPSAVRDRVAALVDEIGSRQDVRKYSEALAALEDRAVSHVRSALGQPVLEAGLGPQFSETELADRLNVASAQRRLLRRVLEMLDGESKLATAPAESAESLLARYPEIRTEVELLDRCGAHLSDVLRGSVDGVDLLFPPGGGVSARDLYEQALPARMMNRIVEESVRAVIGELRPGQTVRILEIGAGTGATSAAILPQLAAVSAEYTFTDISNWFLAQAHDKFRDYRFVQYRLLDIEKTPESQGFESEHYDIVIAATVLHATRDLRQTLRHVRQVLAPGGILILLEWTQALRSIDLIFGLTAGWWHFTDTDLRPAHPLISSDKWQDLLLDSEFDSVAVQRTPDGVLSNQSVLVARAATKQPASNRVPFLRHWLVFADRQGFATSLKRQLEKHLDPCTLVHAGDGFRRVDNRTYEINPENPEDFDRLLDELARRSILHGVIYLWGLDAQIMQTTEAGDGIAFIARQVCGSALQLVQALVRAGLKKPPLLCLVTRGAQPAEGARDVTAPIQSTLWGFGRTVTLEHPELSCLRIDLDAAAALDSLTERLAAAVRERTATTAATTTEDEIAIRLSGRYVSRLRRITTPAAGNHGNGRRFGNAKTYLVTGGLSGLGLLAAEWLVSHGARNLVLMGRSGLAAGSEDRLADMERAGVRVMVARVDVSDYGAVERTFHNIDRSMPPLAGIVHAAGVLNDGILLQQRWDGFRAVMAAKVDGSWHLHTLTRGRNLDFFVLYSTSVSVFGSSGQSNHTAANAFMDSLAYFRRANGLPAQVINWGAWSEVGAAARAEVGERVKLKGIGTIPPRDGMQIFGRMLSEDLVQSVVVPIDWTRFLDYSGNRPFFAQFRSSERVPSSGGETEFLLQLQAAVPRKRRHLMIAVVRTHVARVLGMSSPEKVDVQQGFFELGLDSLTSVELRTRLQSSLGCAVPATAVFDYPNSESLSRFLLTQLFPEEQDTPQGQSEKTNFDSLPEEELAEILSGKLKALRARVGPARKENTGE